MEEAPDKNYSGDDEQAKRLVAPEDTTLFSTARLFRGLLLERLDAEIDHGTSLLSL